MADKMILRNFYIRLDQERFLRTLPGKVSEHIRIAIDDYILDKKQELANVSPSLSTPLKIFYNGKEVTDEFTKNSESGPASE